MHPNVRNPDGCNGILVRPVGRGCSNPTLHEASEEKFVDVANSILKRKNISTKLQTVRKAVGLSQKELSEKSGVTLRMIQQYEQRAKDINKASAGNLFALARVLGCKAEDLLE